MPHYTPQVDEPSSFVDGPPPAYPKGYSVRLQLIRLIAKTAVAMVCLIGAFILLAAYMYSYQSCSCSPDIVSRIDAEPLLAEPTHDVKLHIGENLQDHKGKKSHLNCLVEKREQSLDAMPPMGAQRLKVKGEQTIISCSTSKGKRIRRSPACDCKCAC